jgi:hypothetical protein
MIMSELIKMEKDGEVIEVHPLAMEDHKSLGWKVVGEADADAAPAAASDEKPAAKKKKK